MPKFEEVLIDSIRVSLTNQQRVVVLREVRGQRFLPIWIGPAEAESITIALQEVEVARPQTHDLLRSVISHLGARIARMEVTDLREDVFYANLVLELNDGSTLDIDCRPSDGIALAVRAHVPILVEREVLQKAGQVPEQDVRDQPDDRQMHLPDPDRPAGEGQSEERLSIFEDFLSNLDIDNLDKPEDPDPDAPDKDEPPTAPKA